MTQTATELVRATIQRVYGDATQTVLDNEAASAIVTALRDAGWASPDDVGMLIEAAGGSIVVKPANLLQTDELVVYREQTMAGIRFTARRGEDRSS